jgi:replicative DNA helicase
VSAPYVLDGDVPGQETLGPPAHTNEIAERAVLGALLLGPSAEVEQDVLALVEREMFFRPAHQVIFDSITKVRADHGRIDQLLVLNDLIQRGDINRVGGGPYLHSLIAANNVGSATYFAQQVAESHQRRELLSLATRLAQRANNPGDDLAEIITGARERMEVIELLAGAARAATSGVVDGFAWLQTPIASKPFLVPGLLRAMDRVFLTGTPGAGKSTLLRQIAGLICVGLHPFTRENVDPRRVLVFDCENDEDENWAFFNQLFALTDADGGQRHPGYFQVRHKAGGLDLRLPAHARLLLDAITESRCELCLIGPFYKLSGGNTNEEENARKVTWVLDTIRERTGVTLLIEAHPGHKEITVKDAHGQSHTRIDSRPRGSSLLMGWPEVGIGLQAGLDDTDALEHRFALVDWRGMRHARKWPTEVIAGSRYPWDASQWGSWGRHWVPSEPVENRYEREAS